MSIQNSYLETPRAVGLRVSDVVELLDGMTISAEPAVVFLSVAQLFAPLLCTSTVAAVSEAGERTYRIASPREQPWRPRTNAPDARAAVVAFGGIEVPPHSVVTELCGPATALHSAYEGVLVMTFDRPAPTNSLIGRLVVDRAVSTVTVERLRDIAEMHRAHAENLEAALRSSRVIGIALGIIMDQHRLPEDKAFGLLRRSSQDRQRKVRDLAADIAYTGAFDLPDQTLAGLDGDPS